MENVYSVLEESAGNFPDKLALVYKKNRYTYQDLQKKIDRVKSYIIDKTENQDIISLYMENSDEWIIAYFSILASGCICNPIPLRTSDRNLLYQINFSKPRYLVISNKFTAKCKRLGLGKLTRIITFTDLLKCKPDKKKRWLVEAKYSTIMYTSGTTGRQKAIRLPHAVVCNATKNIVEYLKIDYHDIYYAILPFSHSFGLGNVHITFKMGGTVVVADNTINLKKILKDIVDYKATFLAATPFTLRQFVKNFLPDFIVAGEYLRIICTDTEAMDPEVTKSIIKNLKKTKFFTYYGLTEASRSTFHYYNLYPDKIDSVGRPAPNVYVKVVDKFGKETTPNQTGEISIKGNNVVSEYWKNKEETKKAFRDGWLFTGDMGYFDEDGFLYATGRKDDMVSIAGEKVSLSEIDKILKELDFVQDAACVAEEDKDTKFHIKGLVVLKDKEIKDNHDIIYQKIITCCKKRLENFKIPKYIEFVKSIPRTDSGKLKRPKND